MGVSAESWAVVTCTVV